MRHGLLTLSAALLVCASSGAGAQVYRCGSTSVYTDRPCHGASAVDVRPNILDAGPRHIDPLPAVAPAPAIILQTAPKPAEPSGSVWDRRDAAESEYRGRTGPYRP
ncbi:hypothetical protein WG902_15170 [Ramlibacter sp. PS3R-8]|uniref:hypothetical protein n=1 Tax=Ramlibacter sp. PS3R-8 TaxID=3133437 RepID=UPI0030A002EF